MRRLLRLVLLTPIFLPLMALMWLMEDRAEIRRLADMIWNGAGKDQP